MNTFFNTYGRTCSILLLCMSVCVRVSAIEPEDTTSQRPPYTTISATSVFTVPLIQPDSFVRTTALENPQSVQDTVLTPCDIIFYKTGKLEYCKILETSPTTISYKMCDYQDGPTIVVNKSDIHKIRYANGREDIVDVKPANVKNAYSKGKKYPLATVSLIFGIAALGIIVLFGYAIPALIITGLVLGIISLIKISKRRGELRGKGAAIWGILLSAAALILYLLYAK